MLFATLIAGALVLIQFVSATWVTLGIYAAVAAVALWVQSLGRREKLALALDQRYRQHVAQFGDGRSRAAAGGAIEKVGDFAADVAVNAGHPLFAIAAMGIGFLLGETVRDSRSPEERASEQALAACKQKIDDEKSSCFGRVMLMAAALVGVTYISGTNWMPSHDGRLAVEREERAAEEREQEARATAERARVEAAAGLRELQLLRQAVVAFGEAEPEQRTAALAELQHANSRASQRTWSLVAGNPTSEIEAVLLSQVARANAAKGAAKGRTQARRLEKQYQEALARAAKRVSSVVDSLDLLAADLGTRVGETRVAAAR